MLLADIQSDDLRQLVASLPLGLAYAYHGMGTSIARIERERPCAVLPHLAHAALFFRLTSRILHPPVLRQTLSARLYSLIFVGHFPSRHSAGVGYHYPNGHAGDPTTALLERAVWASVGRPGYQVFADIFDLAVDAFGGPTNHEVARPGGGGTDKFSCERHFFATLSRAEYGAYRQAHVADVAGQMRDELRRGRRGGVLVLCGKVAHGVTRLILEEAAALVAAHTGRAYELLVPGDLPPPARTAAPRGRTQLDHLCMALDVKMCMEERLRWDAALTQALQAVVPVEPVRFFAAQGAGMGAVALGEIMGLRRTAEARAGGYWGRCPMSAALTAAEQEAFDLAVLEERARRRGKRYTAMAKTGGYHGPCPMEQELQPEQAAEYKAALASQLSLVARSGVRARNVAAARRAGYNEPDPFAAGATAGQRAEFDDALRSEWRLWCAKVDTAMARNGGDYDGPCPLEQQLTLQQRAAFDTALATARARRRLSAINARNLAAACRAGYDGPDPFEEDVTEEQQAAFDAALAADRALWCAKVDTAVARTGGYDGPSPLDVELTPPQQAAYNAALVEGRRATRSKADASIARTGGYDGPSPLEAELTPPQQAAYGAALAIARKSAADAGVHTRNLAAARRAGYDGPDPFTEDVTEQQQADFEAALAPERGVWRRRVDTAMAKAGGYVGPCPLETEPSPLQRVAFEAALASERRMVRVKVDTALARAGGYHGPVPWDGPLTPQQQAAFDAALAPARSRAVEAACKARNLAAARRCGYDGPNPFEAAVTREQQADFDAALTQDRGAWHARMKTCVARANGYDGPCPVEVDLTPQKQAEFEAALAAAYRLRATSGNEALRQAAARGGGYFGSLEGQLTATQVSDIAEAQRVYRANLLAKRLPGGYRGPLGRLHEEMSPELKAAITHVGRSGWAARGGFSGATPALDEPGARAFDEAMAKAAREAALMPRRPRRSDAQPPGNVGPRRADDPMVGHLCKACEEYFEVKSLDTVTGAPYKCGNPRHLKCPKASGVTGYGVCWGGKENTNRPACPGCWPFGPDTRTVPPPAEAAAALAAAAERARVAAAAAAKDAATAAEIAARAPAGSVDAVAAARAAQENATEAEILSIGLHLASLRAAEKVRPPAPPT